MLGGRVPAVARPWRKSLAVVLLLGHELLDGVEHHAAGLDPQLLAQVGAAAGLHRRVA